MLAMFPNCKELEYLDLSNFDTSSVNHFRFMFNGCHKLKEIKGLNFDISKTKSLNSMFQGCSDLESIDLSNFNTSNVIHFENMFNRCRKLKEIKGINNFITSNANIMNSMFQGCNELESLDLSNFNTFNVISMCDMFNECFELQFLNLSNFNLDNALDMKRMFYKCYKLKEIKGINNFNILIADTTDMFEDYNEFDGYKEIKLKLNNNGVEDLQQLNSINTVQKKIYVYLTSTDQNVNYAISCYNTDNFKIVEEKLYSEFPELKNKNLIFLANGSVINKSLTLEENKISSGTHILINNNE